jgi:hypothetical protein
MKKLLYLAIPVLYLLHQDFWFWKDRTLVMGFVPIGFFYHILYCLAASALLLALIRFAWPASLEREASLPSEEKEARPWH